MSNPNPRVAPITLPKITNVIGLTFLQMFISHSYYSWTIMHQDHHELLYQAIRKLIPPPNPIINKHIPPDQPVQMIAHSLPILRAVDLPSEDQQEAKEEECTLSSTYNPHDLVFQRWQNRNNTRNNVTYFASNFCERNNKDNLQYIGQLQGNCLEFNCNFDSGNLLAAYKTGEAQYDLILQNDLNSGGYTQWFNFTVSNYKHKGTVKFNIVNFYKKESLFKEGMKPITRSLIHDKNWKRSCHNIEYFISEMRMQGRKSKCYKILSFKYDFIFQADTVQFAYCLPYSYQRLNNFLKGLNSAKLRVKYLGATPMKKIVTMLQLSSESEEKKKAIVVMARQHAGQTPASHVVQYMIEELLGSTQENEFLFSKYNFYIFPMVNVDGVFLGNYRCNFYGFDLNRCWHLEQSKKHPEIGLIKNQIKRIMKREAIELILDLHGHSAKMNSFFYGNTFGRYNMYFPLVAAKLQEFIDFNSCSFTQQEYEKSNTARVVLGNMIRQTGSAYTFQISLYGGTKNGKKIPFTGEHYQNMARNLVLAMYKCDVELYKEEKFLKESLFLREVRKEIRKYEAGGRNKYDNCSDQEAKKISMIEEKIKIVPQVINASKRIESEREKQEKMGPITEQQESQTDFQLVLEDYKMSGTFLNDLVDRKPPQQKKKKLSFSIRKVLGGVQQTSRKHELMNKLRIFGETFAQESSNLENSSRPAQSSTKETQTLLIYRWRQESPLHVRDMSRSNPRSTTFLANSFLGRRLGEQRRRQRFPKSNSTRVTQAEVSFCDLIKHNKLSFC